MGFEQIVDGGEHAHSLLLVGRVMARTQPGNLAKLALHPERLAGRIFRSVGGEYPRLASFVDAQ